MCTGAEIDEVIAFPKTLTDKDVEAISHKLPQ